jgi:hypothetical protein
MNRIELSLKEARTALWDLTGRIIAIDLLMDIVLDPSGRFHPQYDLV